MTNPNGEIQEGLFDKGMFKVKGTEEEIKKKLYLKNDDQNKQVKLNEYLDK